MKVTTKRGDTGVTNLFNKTGIQKNDPIIALLGDNDEIQSLLGMVKTVVTKTQDKSLITTIQKRIYHIMGELSGAATINDSIVMQWADELEKEEKRLMESTPIQNIFVIPGENSIEAWCQYARTRTRALERSFCTFAQQQTSVKKFIPFFNRLSDYLFVLGNTYTV